jgi:TorA maturation chaperone TorD
MLPDDAQIAALAAGVRILSEMFWGPKFQDSRDILAGSYFQPLKTLESMLEYNPPDVLHRIESGLKYYPDADALFQYLETEYVRLFISHRDGIAAPLYESCYTGAQAGDAAPLMGKSAIRMKARFESRGLSLDSNINEPPDHLAIELEYLYFLMEKGRADKDRNLIAEASSFASDSMLPWITRLQKRLTAAETEDSFYLLITKVLCAVVKYIGGI